jgi:hypothetical protein
VQIFFWAAAFVALGEFESWEASLYFSTVTFTTVG